MSSGFCRRGVVGVEVGGRFGQGVKASGFGLGNGKSGGENISEIQLARPWEGRVFGFNRWL